MAVRLDLRLGSPQGDEPEDDYAKVEGLVADGKAVAALLRALADALDPRPVPTRFLSPGVASRTPARSPAAAGRTADVGGHPQSTAERAVADVAGRLGRSLRKGSLGEDIAEAAQRGTHGGFPFQTARLRPEGPADEAPRKRPTVPPVTEDSATP